MSIAVATIGTTQITVNADWTQTVKRIKVKEDFKQHLRSSAKKVKELIYERIDEPYITLEITPTPSTKNYNAYTIARMLTTCYEPFLKRLTFHFSKQPIKYRPLQKISFKTVLSSSDVIFYITVPESRKFEIMQKCESVYDSNIDIKIVKSVPKVDVDNSEACALVYEHHDIFSLNTDRDTSYPLPSIMATTTTMTNGDLVMCDVLIEPYSSDKWRHESMTATNKLYNHELPMKSTNVLLGSVNWLFNMLRNGLSDMFAFSKEQRNKIRIQKLNSPTARMAKQLRSEMTEATKKKSRDDVLAVQIRIVAQSDDKNRRRELLRQTANAYKDLDKNNELKAVDITPTWKNKFIECVNTNRGFKLGFSNPVMSDKEAGKFIQLPGHRLMDEYKNIRSKKVKDTRVSSELMIGKLKSLAVGKVNVKGTEVDVSFPLEPYETRDESGGTIKVDKKALYDALCTTTFAQGKVGSGKTVLGQRTSYDMLMAGFSVIVTDTADGEMLKDIINSLPEDFPDEKIHVINLDNKAYPIPLDWSDIYSRDFSGDTDDQELQALEVSERITQRFVDFINSLKNNSDGFSDRMQQYLISCLRAVTTLPVWSFLDLELSLTSPSFREELLELDSVQKQPDVVRDLEFLQARAAEEKDRPIIDPILSRIKELSSSQFLANLFLQTPKLDEEGKSVLNFRKIMDNEEGGYGHLVCIYASHDAWQDNQTTILGFIEDKINFNAFSRVDISQEQRKPVLKWIDEPHKVIKNIEHRISGSSVEFRKYRIKSLYTGHSIDQMGAAAKSLLDGGAQVISFKTERQSELERFAHQFKPYDNAEELYSILPEKHTAVVKLRLPSGRDSEAFIAKMTPPPKFVKDRSYIWDECARRYGRHWKEVKEEIQTKRGEYLEDDIEWIESIKKRKKEEDNAEKELLKEKKKADQREAKISAKKTEVKPKTKTKSKKKT